MKKIKKCMIAIVVFATVIINSTGCESKPIMDEDKCAEVALEYMKNKYQKLHRIVIGKSGSGKSFSILSGVKEDNKINVICYPEVIGAHLDVYEKAFPRIFLKYRQEAVSTVSTMPPHITNINENTLLKCDHHYSPNIFNLIEWAKQDSEDLSRYRFIFLDSLWNQLNQADKIKYLER